MFDLDATQTEDGFFDVDLNNVLSTNFYELPEGVTLRFSLNRKQECFLSAEGNLMVIQIELTLFNESDSGEQQKKADERLMEAIKNLRTQKTMMAEEGIYFNGSAKIFYWSYREPNTIQADRLFRNLTIDGKYIYGVASKVFGNHGA